MSGSETYDLKPACHIVKPRMIARLKKKRSCGGFDSVPGSQTWLTKKLPARRVNAAWDHVPAFPGFLQACGQIKCPRQIKSSYRKNQLI